MDFSETMKLLDEMISDMKVKEKIGKQSDIKIIRDSPKLATNAKCEITEAFVDVMQKYAADFTFEDVLDICVGMSKLIKDFPVDVLHGGGIEKTSKCLKDYARKVRNG